MIGNDGQLQACRSCRFFWDETHECRRYAPVLNLIGYGTEMGRTLWPPVEEDWWCGDFQRRAA